MGDLLHESQEDRDAELAAYSGRPADELRALPIGAPESILIHAGPDIDAQSFDDLYRVFRHLDPVHYLRTLAALTVRRRAGYVFLVEQHLGGFAGQRVLDFGCGVGTHGLYAAERGAAVDLLDVDGPLRSYASWRAERRRLPVQLLDQDAVLEPGTYDAVLCLDVLEHLADPVGALRRIAAAMRPGAVLALEVSTMVKPSSGHFGGSVRRWQAGGTVLLQELFASLIDRGIYARSKAPAV